MTTIILFKCLKFAFFASILAIFIKIWVKVAAMEDDRENDDKFSS